MFLSSFFSTNFDQNEIFSKIMSQKTNTSKAIILSTFHCQGRRISTASSMKGQPLGMRRIENNDLSGKYLFIVLTIFQFHTQSFHYIFPFHVFHTEVTKKKTRQKKKRKTRISQFHDIQLFHDIFPFLVFHTEVIYFQWYTNILYIM